MNGSERPRILFCYSRYADPTDVRLTVEALCSRLQARGLRIDCEPITLDAPGPPLTWSELDARWRRGDRALLTMYDRLVRRLDGFDVLLNGSGINLHPEFVRQLPVTTAFACFDDPESSAVFSQPVAAAYDTCLVGNIACLDDYRAWGARDVHWWPLGFRDDDCDPSLTESEILGGERDVQVALLCERVTDWRSRRLDRFAAAIPDGIYRGRGWPLGWLPSEQRVPLYRRTRIGPNFHNSLGPVNARTFILPANGVMQICDNRRHLSGVFELDREVVGVETVDEAIDATRYYLAHDDERRRIAAAGWRRAHRDYSESAVYARMEGIVTAAWRRKGTTTMRAASHLAPMLIARRNRKPLAVGMAAVRAWAVALRRTVGRLLRNIGLRR